jgi:transcription initiation factor TFIIIB Brf1 subunit/transcription initiation factor TFIIB
MADLWPALHKNPAAATATAVAEVDPFDDLFAELESAATQTCSVCEDDAAIETDGSDLICMRCGSIIDTPLERGAEYRWFSSESGGGPDPSRCGFPVNHLMPESSLGTMILARGGSAAMNRLKRYHNWILMPYRERTLWNIIESLQVRATNAGISTAAIEEAKELFAQQTASDICRGQAQRDAMLAACLWEALKRHGTPRIPKDIAAIFNIPLKQVTKGIKKFQHLFAIRTSGQMTDTYANPAKKSPESDAKDTIVLVESEETITARAFQRRAIWQKTASRTTSYEDFVGPFLKNLSAPRHLESLVSHVCGRTEVLGIVPENTPPSLTASVIAFCCQELGIKMDIAEIARVCGISAVTIQKCLKRLIPAKEKLLEQ